MIKLWLSVRSAQHCLTHLRWRRSTSPSTQPPTLPKRSKSNLYLHSVSFAHSASWAQAIMIMIINTNVIYVFAKYLFFYSLAMEASGFLDALNSAPVPGIKIKKKKTKAVSPTSNKVCYSDGFMCLSMLVSPLNTHSLTIFYLSCSSPVRSTAGHSHTRAHRPNPLPPRLPHLTPLLMRTKTWSSPAHRCPPKTLKQWTPVSHVTQNSAKNFC